MKVLLVPNYSRQPAQIAAAQIAEFLESQGIEVVWAHDKKLHPEQTTSADGCGLAISLGGDGTLLRAAKIVGYSEIPLLGLSFGHLGFLTAADGENLLATIEDALAGELHMQRRMALDCEVYIVDAEGDVRSEHHFALNELALTRGSAGDMVDIELMVSDTHIDKLRADGVVVSTATGSTGYSLSAGGPIVHPDFMGMVCVPIAPHTIMARAFLTSPSDVVELRVDPERDVERTCFVDGQLVGLQEGDVVIGATVRRGPGDVVLLDGGPKSFYNNVSRVFYGKTRRNGA